MKKLILLLLFLFIPAFAYGNGSGIVFYKTDCSTSIELGMLCVDTDDNKAYKGTGVGITEIDTVGEGETHATEHGVSGDDSIFPADPNSDKYLMWDDDPGALSWQTIAGGGDMLKATYDTDDDGKVNEAEEITCVGCIADAELASTFIKTETDPNVDTEAEIEAITGAYFGASKVVTGGYIWVADGGDFESVPMSGDVSIASGGATIVSNDSHDHSAIGSTVTINAADITDKNAGTDITADLEEDSHCTEHDSTDVDCSGETILVVDDQHNHTTTTISGLDLSADVNLTAGRSLTLTDDDVAADAELYTDSFTINLETPATGDNGKFSKYAELTFTITKVYCSVDSGTVTININERALATPDTTGTDVLSSGLVCDTNTQTSCASGCDVNTITNASIDVTDPVALEIDATSGTPTILRVTVVYTSDD